MPLQSEKGPSPRLWDGNSRVNILLLGVDDRAWVADSGPPRTDTIIVVTIDPQKKTAGMLSLPRDLWVPIPNHGESKINQAYVLGEANDYPGAGPGLAMATVEQFLDISIPFYVQINFSAFVQMVDEIEGVKVDVPERISIDPLGDGNTRILQPGVQTLPGDLALAYVRARNTAGGDFDRAERQQQVLQSIQQRITDFRMLPKLINRAPALYKEAANGVSTNLTFQQLFQLAQLGYQIPDENIQHLVISHEHVTETTSYQGWYILLPIPDQIESLRAALFSGEPSSQPAPITNTATPYVAVQTQLPTPSQAIQAETPTPRPQIPTIAEGASVAVYNGTATSGLAGRTAEYLASYNINVIEIGNADERYSETTIFDHTGNPETITYLAELLDVPISKIYNRYDPNTHADVSVILGGNWAEKNPLP
jgi:LCP family protein required for cell wall assembly